ncbi:MAG: PAS domain-containing protein [Candidatus Latescibacterota bacterium]
MNGKDDLLDSQDMTEIEAAAGNSAAVFALFRRKQKVCEEAFRKQKAEFDTLAGNITDGIVRFDRDFQITFVNFAAAEMMRSTREELLGKTPVEFPMPLHLASMWHGGVKRALVLGQNVSFEYEFDDLRTVHYLQITMIPEFGPDGAIESVLAITRDISGQKQSVVALRESEERFKLALGTAPIAVYSQDGSLRYTWGYSSNPKLSAESFLGHTDRDIYPAEEADQMTAVKHRVIQTGQPEHAELEATTPGGKIWLDITIAPLRNNEGQIVGVTGVALDITDRKRAEEALEASRIAIVNEKNRLEAVMDTLPAGVAILDERGGNVHTNRMYNEIWSGPLPSTRDVGDYVHYKAWWPDTGEPVKPEEWAAAIAVQKGETVIGQEIEIERFDGARAFVLNSGAPIRDANGNITGSVVAILDITDRKRAEERIKWLADFPLRNPNPILQVSAEGVVLFVNDVSRDLRETWQVESGGVLPEPWRSVAAEVLLKGGNAVRETMVKDRFVSLTFAALT